MNVKGNTVIAPHPELFYPRVVRLSDLVHKLDKQVFSCYVSVNEKLTQLMFCFTNVFENFIVFLRKQCF